MQEPLIKLLGVADQLCSALLQQNVGHLKEVNKSAPRLREYMFDKVELFKARIKGTEIQPGLYYVECNNYMPLRGNGWYSHKMFYIVLKITLLHNRSGSEARYVTSCSLNSFKTKAC
jgi:hypothetical protein